MDHEKRDRTVTSIYLSSDNPRWMPKTEADLQAAVDGGLFEESHHLDLKKAPSSKGDNKELARDLSSFAVDGGALVIGVQENKENRTFELAPQPLNGLPEKVEQVARTIPDPPLTIITEEISSAADDGTGYLIVHIPASPVAPHMVDNRYFGRGDKTKYQMGDAEVVSLHTRRRNIEADTLTLLRKEMEEDPLRDVGAQSHLFLVAQPTAGRRDMCLPITGAQDWNLRLHTLIKRVQESKELRAALVNQGFSPDLGDAHQGHRRARGVARSSAGLRSDRTYAPEGRWGDEDVIEVQLFEDGGLRLFMTRLSDSLRERHTEEGDAEQVLFDAAAVILTRHMLELIRLVSDDVGYHGNWAVAVGANRLRGRRRYSGQSHFPSNHRYSADTYEESTGATLAELREAPGTVTRRLLGPLLRSLDSAELFAKALADEG
ncbi:AlbA family DNA-binding domain-containing protein [Streptomyces europaeiscabiei]|uniref:AlbA family DNA-binding domain-containing protein n=1 Tax=Streptomyces europaeiscabiei TaxID=146819 RepID=UPI0029BDFECC|nr:ATP-binding protein [Streptomyces europaeiscabiei]MDX3588919.1 ATP-binding protein [Streptomyces europaeiscabiei]